MQSTEDEDGSMIIAVIGMIGIAISALIGLVRDAMSSGKTAPTTSKLATRSDPKPGAGVCSNVG